MQVWRGWLRQVILAAVPRVGGEVRRASLGGRLRGAGVAAAARRQRVGVAGRRRGQLRRSAVRPRSAVGQVDGVGQPPRRVGGLLLRGGTPVLQAVQVLVEAHGADAAARRGAGVALPLGGAMAGFRRLRWLVLDDYQPHLDSIQEARQGLLPLVPGRPLRPRGQLGWARRLEQGGLDGRVHLLERVTVPRCDAVRAIEPRRRACYRGTRPFRGAAAELRQRRG
mmetsp:Transcript_97958/g.277663  ORF Transcript_97958/g.277663 Transcript_97958/m.277663 type:complete len:224 (+) Transcript_97958:1507-2178(+)